MAKSCKIKPSNCNILFDTANKKLGRKAAITLYYVSNNPDFRKKYEKSLSIDAEGFPTLESLLSIKEVRDLIQDTKIMEMLNNEQKVFENTRTNYDICLGQAHTFNTTSTYKDRFIAVVEKKDKGIAVTIVPKNKNNIDLFKNQYGTKTLNDAIARIFEPIGITVGNLSVAEERAGRRGVTNFEAAKRVCKDFASIIRVANNMEGAEALLEENCHLIIGALLGKDDPMIKRAIALLKSNPELIKTLLGGTYRSNFKYHEGNLDKLAEEALGHLLMDKLKRDNTTRYKIPVLNRIVDYIKSLFRKISLKDVQSALHEADSLLNNLASSIHNDTLKLTEKDILSSGRNLKLNSLREDIDRNIEILQKLLDVETKRYQIVKDPDKKNKIKNIAEGLSNTIEEVKNSQESEKEKNLKTIQSFFTFMSHILVEIDSVRREYATYEELNMKEKFNLLNRSRIYIHAYDEYLRNMQKIVAEESTNEDSEFLQSFDLAGESTNIKELLQGVIEQHILVQEYYKAEVISTFSSWLESRFGKYITAKDGEKISIQSIVSEARNGDIAFHDRWVSSMADSSDELLQMVDLMVKAQRDKTHTETISYIKRIQRWLEKAKELGISDYEWMFEKDKNGNKTGYYIRPINIASLTEDYNKYIDGLKERGKKEVDIKILGRKWLAIHQNDPKYKNSEYYSLSESYKKILEEYLDLKEEMENGSYPPHIVDRYKCIQDRMSGTQRFLTSTTPTKIVENIKTSILTTFFSKSDDVNELGNLESSVLKHFDGSELLTLPLYYTVQLENPNELSTDVGASLMKYAYATSNYRNMSEITDALDTGKIILKGERKTPEKRAGKILVEKMFSWNRGEQSVIYKEHTRILEKYLDYIKAAVYGLPKAEVGSIQAGELGKLDGNKVVSWLLRTASSAQMKLNIEADFANLLTGEVMTAIEALFNEYFNAKTLTRATKEYIYMIPEHLANKSSLIKNDKLSLFIELFNVDQNFKTNINNANMKKLAERVLGSEWGYIGQEVGNSWIYNRIAIAICIEKKVFVPGVSEPVSLWDALEIRNEFGDNSRVKRMYLKEGVTDLEGNPIDLFEVKEIIRNTIQGIVGNYSDEDPIAANRYVIGSFLMMYRRFIVPQFNKRFRWGRYNVIKKVWERGYHIEFFFFLGGILNDLYHLKWQVVTSKIKNIKEEKALMQALTEYAVFLTIYALISLGYDDDDDDKEKINKRSRRSIATEYYLRRLHHEVGFFTPTWTMLSEWRKNLANPIPLAATIDNMINLVQSLATPADYVNEIERGPYKGMSTLEKHFYKAPIPVVSQYKQMHDYLYNLDQSILFYKRQY